MGESNQTATAPETLPHYAESPRPTDTLGTDTTDYPETAQPGPGHPVAAGIQADHPAEACHPTTVPAPVAAHQSTALTTDHLTALAEEVQPHTDTS